MENQTNMDHHCSDNYLELIVSFNTPNKYDCENLLDEIKEKLPEEYYFFFMLSLSCEISLYIERLIDNEIKNISKYKQEILPTLELSKLKEIYDRKIKSNFDNKSVEILNSILRERLMEE